MVVLAELSNRTAAVTMAGQCCTDTAFDCGRRWNRMEVEEL